MICGTGRASAVQAGLAAGALAATLAAVLEAPAGVHAGAIAEELACGALALAFDTDLASVACGGRLGSATSATVTGIALGINAERLVPYRATDLAHRAVLGFALTIAADLFFGALLVTPATVFGIALHVFASARAKLCAARTITGSFDTEHRVGALVVALTTVACVAL